MSTNIPLDSVPDPESVLLPEVIEGDVLPSLLPIFDDLISEESAKRLPESYDEVTAIATLKSQQEKAVVPIGRTWLFNFNTGNFAMSGQAPQKSTGNETENIKQWIRRALTTERYIYNIYPDWFGIELDVIISGLLTGQAAIDHIAGQIRETLIMHDRISDVIDIVAVQDGNQLLVKMKVLLDRENVIDITEQLRVF